MYIYIYTHMHMMRGNPLVSRESSENECSNEWWVFRVQKVLVFVVSEYIIKVIDGLIIAICNHLFAAESMITSSRTSAVAWALLRFIALHRHLFLVWMLSREDDNLVTKLVSWWRIKNECDQHKPGFGQQNV